MCNGTKGDKPMNKDTCKNPNCQKILKDGEARMTLSNNEIICYSCYENGYMRTRIENDQKIWKDLYK